MTEIRKKYNGAIQNASEKFEQGVTAPPDNWQQDARAALMDAFDMMMHWAIFIQAIRIALQDNDYQEFLDALMWLEAERANPNE